MGKLYAEEGIWFPKFFSAILTQNMLFNVFLQVENSRLFPYLFSCMNSPCLVAINSLYDKKYSRYMYLCVLVLVLFQTDLYPYLKEGMKHKEEGLLFLSKVLRAQFPG